MAMSADAMMAASAPQANRLFRTPAAQPPPGVGRGLQSAASAGSRVLRAGRIGIVIRNRRRRRRWSGALGLVSMVAGVAIVMVAGAAAKCQAGGDNGQCDQS